MQPGAHLRHIRRQERDLDLYRLRERWGRSWLLAGQCVARARVDKLTRDLWVQAFAGVARDRALDLNTDWLGIQPPRLLAVTWSPVTSAIGTP